MDFVKKVPTFEKKKEVNRKFNNLKKLYFHSLFGKFYNFHLITPYFYMEGLHLRE